MRIYNMSR